MFDNYKKVSEDFMALADKTAKIQAEWAKFFTFGLFRYPAA